MQQKITNPEYIGKKVNNPIPVEISTQFLKHFSEQLYSSPQKAFEELISNGWDAGADFIDIRIPELLSEQNATVLIFDNGCSMDESGLRELWHIAFSSKAEKTELDGRKLIGRFGIGKLATYVLATKLTYICKATDGIIRRVTMDYEVVDTDADPQKLVSSMQLDLFTVDENELISSLGAVQSGDKILEFIKNETQCHIEKSEEFENEFGCLDSKSIKRNNETWTLVLLSGLKPSGQKLKVGVLKRMLEAALPLSNEIDIFINSELIRSSKSVVPIAKEWRFGEEKIFESFNLFEDDPDPESELSTTDNRSFAVNWLQTPYPHAVIEDVGEITGTLKLFESKISGGKSDEHGQSNGFFINVLGRIVNQQDQYFGIENLSHSVWSRFRLCVRADALNKALVTSREKFQETAEIKIFRSFLKKCFNIARKEYSSDNNLNLTDGGDALVGSLGVLSLAPLKSAVSETLRTAAPIEGLFDESGIIDREKARESWNKETSEHINNAVSSVKYGKIDDGSFVQFKISDNSIIINNEHPFVVEHNRSKAEKELLRTVGMAHLLSDVYALESGIEPSKVEAVRKYRDQILEYRAIQRRQSGGHIAKILLGVQHESSNSKKFEVIIGDALSYLGFEIKRLGQPGEPEGIASAITFESAKDAQGNEPYTLYSFTYDAKSTKNESAKTGNLSLDGVNEHKVRYKADYALVVAPDFEKGAVSTRCDQLKITPLKASDLCQLLQYTVEYGAIPLPKFAEMFSKHDPDEVAKWVSELKEALMENRKLSIDIFLKALKSLEGKIPDVLEPTVISQECGKLGVKGVLRNDVIRLVDGLSIIAPDIIGYDRVNNKIFINANGGRVEEVIRSQLENFHKEIKPEDV